MSANSLFAESEVVAWRQPTAAVGERRAVGALCCLTWQLFTLTACLFFSPGFCRLIPHPRSPGTWTIYFEGADYESHLLRENTELVSTVRWQAGQGRKLDSFRFEDAWLCLCSFICKQTLPSQSRAQVQFWSKSSDPRAHTERPEGNNDAC